MGPCWARNVNYRSHHITSHDDDNSDDHDDENDDNNDDNDDHNGDNNEHNADNHDDDNLGGWDEIGEAKIDVLFKYRCSFGDRFRLCLHLEVLMMIMMITMAIIMIIMLTIMMMITWRVGLRDILAIP